MDGTRPTQRDENSHNEVPWSTRAPSPDVDHYLGSFDDHHIIELGIGVSRHRFEFSDDFLFDLVHQLL